MLYATVATLLFLQYKQIGYLLLRHCFSDKNIVMPAPNDNPSPRSRQTVVIIFLSALALSKHIFDLQRTQNLLFIPPYMMSLHSLAITEPSASIIIPSSCFSLSGSGDSEYGLWKATAQGVSCRISQIAASDGIKREACLARVHG
jgi:hypothetical protein